MSTRINIKKNQHGLSMLEALIAMVLVGAAFGSLCDGVYTNMHILNISIRKIEDLRKLNDTGAIQCTSSGNATKKTICTYGIYKKEKLYIENSF